MIDKLPEIQIHSCAKINEKLNEVIDWINDVSALRVTDKQVTANLPNIDAGELAFLSKENSDLKDELERTRKALDYAIGVIQTVAKMSNKLSREYGETLVEQLDNIQAYCWQEGYVLTHEEDLERAITALEQKDVK